MDPLSPTVLDGVLTAVSLVALLLALAALVSLIRSRAIAGRRLLGWALVVILVPIIGPAAWFVVRSRQRSIAPTESGVGS
ncbi:MULTISPECIES: PLDc N-terminal domain-containing protein [unclassified Curtobacterium]|uniref:PLDc N-terminal domain-containing protein n=1 Tax=unclassified Curtobacterium TaxID=257496 RepID=UPI00380AF30C